MLYGRVMLRRFGRVSHLNILFIPPPVGLGDLGEDLEDDMVRAAVANETSILLVIYLGGGREGEGGGGGGL